MSESENAPLAEEQQAAVTAAAEITQPVSEALPVESPPEEEVTPEPTEADLAHEEFLKEHYGEDSTPSTPTDTTPTPPLSPEIEEAVAARIAEMTTAAQRQQSTQAQQQAYNNTAQTVYNWALQSNHSPQEAQQLASLFTAFADTVAPVHRSDATAAENIRVVSQFYDEAAKLLPASRRQPFIEARGKDHKSPADTVKAIYEAGRTGYVSEHDAKQREAKAVTDYKAFLETKGLLVGGKSPPTGTTGSGVAGRANFKTLGEAEAAHVAGKISNADMRRLAGTLPR